MCVLLNSYAIIAIGGMAILIAVASVYGITNMNNHIQAQPSSTALSDNSAKLDSLKSQIDSLSSRIDSMNSKFDSMSGKLATLDTLKSNVADIQGKISDIESKSNQVSQTPATVPLALLLDRATYNPGDIIKITAIGVNPLKSAQIQLLDNTGYVIMHTDTWSDSTGKLGYNLQLSSSLLAGSYKVQLVSDQQTQSQSITIGGSSSSQNTGTFTAQTDKSVYATGTMIQVSGIGQAGTSVSGVMTSPSGKTFSTVVTVQSDGTYTMFFSQTQPYETGQWSIAVTNLGQTRTLLISIGTGSSSNSGTFTAVASKTTYNRGEIVQVSGTGPAGTSVTGSMAGPSGTTYGSSASVRNDGTYLLTFSTVSSDAIGTWNITVTNQGQTRIVSIYLQ